MKSEMSPWSLVHRTVSDDGRRAISFFINEQGHAKFVHERWQKYYEPSLEDANSPVAGGLWSSEFESGLYLTFADADTDAHVIVGWY